MKSGNRHLYKPPPTEDYSKNFCKLYIVIAISFVFISAEFVGGYISGSIAVISDAFHLVTDLIGFGVSYIFINFSMKDPTQKMSFGFHRMELIGALGNLFIIWFLAIFMIYEATQRIISKQFVAEPLAMLIVGVGGLVINIIMYFVLHSGSHSHGLMSEPCDHHHEPHDNDPNPSNCTTSFCNELICEDEDCLKLVNFSHCHIKDLKGQAKIHIHNDNRKLSDELDGRIEQNTMNNLDNSSNKIHNSKNLNNVNVSPFIQQTKKQHNHVHGQNCKHDHKQDNQMEIELKISPLKENKKQQAHVHGQNCSHKHENNHKHEKKEEHKHGEGCKHGHGENHNHKHEEGHSHNHDDHGHEHHSHNHQQHESISMQAAVLHALSDVIQSIGLLISSLFIFFLGSDKGAPVDEWNDWHYFDPISTYIFSVIVILSTFPIVKNCYYLIMEATPSTETARQIKRQFEQAPGVVDVHDLHIWCLKPGKNLLIAHVFAKEGAEREVLTNLTEICRRKKLFHSTLQVEEQNWKNHEQYILCDHDIH